ncbi:hypothetical protein RCL1_006377 [Eukaryota sp. TZLM3-RCL]
MQQNLQRLLQTAVSQSDSLNFENIRQLSAEDVQFLENALQGEGETMNQLLERFKSVYSSSSDVEELEPVFEDLQDALLATYNANYLITANVLDFFFNTLLTDSRDRIVSETLNLLTICSANNLTFQEHICDHYSAVTLCLSFIDSQNDSIRLRACGLMSAVLAPETSKFFSQEGIEKVSFLLNDSIRVSYRVLHFFKKISVLVNEFPDHFSHLNAKTDQLVSKVFEVVSSFDVNKIETYTIERMELALEFLINSLDNLTADHCRAVQNLVPKSSQFESLNGLALRLLNKFQDNYFVFFIFVVFGETSFIEELVEVS